MNDRLTHTHNTILPRLWCQFLVFWYLTFWMSHILTPNFTLSSSALFSALSISWFYNTSHPALLLPPSPVPMPPLLWTIDSIPPSLQPSLHVQDLVVPLVSSQHLYFSHSIGLAKQFIWVFPYDDTEWTWTHTCSRCVEYKKKHTKVMMGKVPFRKPVH